MTAVNFRTSRVRSGNSYEISNGFWVEIYEKIEFGPFYSIKVSLIVLPSIMISLLLRRFSNVKRTSLSCDGCAYTRVTNVI